MSDLKIPDTPRFAIRLSDDDKAAWRAAALDDGFNSLSTWLKTLARNRLEVKRIHGGRLK